MSDYPNTRDCEHGRQRGKCELCDLRECEAERDRWRAEAMVARQVTSKGGWPNPIGNERKGKALRAAYTAARAANEAAEPAP